MTERLSTSKVKKISNIFDISILFTYSRVSKKLWVMSLEILISRIFNHLPQTPQNLISRIFNHLPQTPQNPIILLRSCPFVVAEARTGATALAPSRWPIHLHSLSSHLDTLVQSSATLSNRTRSSHLY